LSDKPKRKPKGAAGGRPRADRPAGRSGSRILARRVDDDSWELVHPRCAIQRADDLEEIREMLAADETEIACDELRWLLGGCNDFIEAHRLLGEIALGDGDVPLARGHFGIAFQLGLKATANCKGKFPLRHEANRGFLESGKQLAWCLKLLGKEELLVEAINQLLKLDPADPFEVKALR
jgi:hypothetical protein